MESHGSSDSRHLEQALDYEFTKSHTSIFILPPEIRQSIWEYALPDKRILQPSGRFDQASGGWIFAISGTDGQPSLTQVCRETRQFMLRNGDFIFGKDPTEAGLWWNPKADTLLFTYEWDLRFEWNALEGLRGLDKVKNVIIDQDFARWMSYRPIYPWDLPGYDLPGRFLPLNAKHAVGFRLCYPDDSPYFKFFLFNGIHPDNLAVLFSRLLQEPEGRLDNCELPDVRVDFDFINDDMDEVKRKLARMGDLWEQSRQQNPPDRYVINTNFVLRETVDKPGPLFRRGASCEEKDDHVDITDLVYFQDMFPGWNPFT